MGYSDLPQLDEWVCTIAESACKFKMVGILFWIIIWIKILDYRQGILDYWLVAGSLYLVFFKKNTINVKLCSHESLRKHRMTIYIDLIHWPFKFSAYTQDELLSVYCNYLEHLLLLSLCALHGFVNVSYLLNNKFILLDHLMLLRKSTVLSLLARRKRISLSKLKWSRSFSRDQETLAHFQLKVSAS